MKHETASYTNQLGWEIIDTWTAAVTTPAVAARSYEEVKAITTVLAVPDRINAIQLRATGTTNNHSEVVDVLVARNEKDTFTRIATLTITIGQQQKEDGTTLLADTIVASNVRWPTASYTVLSGADDYQASVWFDLLGHQYVAVVPTTVAGTLGVEYSGV